MSERKPWFINGYTVLTAAFLLLRLFFWFSPGHEAKMQMIYLWPAALAALTLAIWQRRKAPPRGMRLMLALVAWFFAVNLLNGDFYLEYNGRFLLGIALSMGVCFLAVPMMPERTREKQTVLLAVLYTGMMLIPALLSLYAAASHQLLSTPLSDRSLGIQEHRLYIFAYHPNEVACAFSVAFFLSLALALRARSAAGRIPAGLALLVFYAAISLTVSRTVMITVSLGLGAAVMLVCFHCLAKRGLVLRLAAGVAALALTAALAFIGFTPAMNAISSLPVPAASAESTAAPSPSSALVERDLLEDLSTFTSRTELWQAGISYLKDRPITLLIGSTDAVVARVPHRYAQRAEYHLHNIWLEILLQVGIPGLLLYAAFVLGVLWHGLQALRTAALPLWRRFLPIAFLLLSVNALMEIYPGVSGNVMDMMYFLLGGAILTDPGVQKISG